MCYKVLLVCACRSSSIFSFISIYNPFHVLHRGNIFPDFYLQIRALNTAKYKMQSYSFICKRLFHTAFISVMEAAIMNIFLNLHVHIRHCYLREHAYICGRKLVIKITDDIFLHASTEYYQSK